MGNRLVQTFIEAAGVACVRVKAPTELAAARISVSSKRETPSTGFVRSLWCSSASAREIADAVTARPIALSAAGAIALIEATAAELGIGMTPEAAVVARAEAAIAAVDRNMTAMAKTGGLRVVNAKYKAYRKSNAGVGALPYKAWLNRYREGLLVDLAKAANGRK